MDMVDDKNQRLARAIMSIHGVLKEGEVKDSKSKRTKYAYARVDDIFVEVRSHLAAEGLVSWQNQEFLEFRNRLDPNGEITGENIFGKFNHAILGPGQICPEPGEIENVFVETSKFGPQSFAGLRTFAHKYYLRNKLWLPLGSDFDDLDSVFASENDSNAAPESDATTLSKAKWIMKNSGLLVPDGQWPDEHAKQSSFLRAFRAATALPDNPNDGQKEFLHQILEKNLDTIYQLPDNGIEFVVSCLDKVNMELPPNPKDS